MIAGSRVRRLIGAGTRRWMPWPAGRPRRAARLVGAVAGALLLAACGGGDGGVAPGIDAIVIQPSNPSIAVGSQLTLTASVTGGTQAARSVFWSSADPSVASVSSAGVVTAVKIGSTQIAASAGGRSGVTTVQVVPEAVGRVSLTLTPASAQVGDTVQASATVATSDGRPLTGRTVTFTSLDPTLAAVIANGRVVALNAGSARIVARSDEVADTAVLSIGAAVASSITVVPAALSLSVGGAATLVVTARDRSGNLVSRPVSYTSENSNVARVSSGGQVTGVAPGTTSITVRVDAVTTQIPVSVSAVPVGQVVVEPKTPSLLVGQSVGLAATVIDINGDTLKGATVQWSSDSITVATVNGAGVVSAVGVGANGITGRAVITASVGGKQDIAVVSTSYAAVQSVSVQPATVSLAPSDSVQLSATATNVLGKVDGRAVTWATTSSAIATVSATGLVKAGLTAGTAKIAASLGGKSDTAYVTVALTPVQSVHINNGPTAPIVAGDTVDLTVTVTNTAGQPDPRTPAWSTSDPAVVSVDGSGRVAAEGPGTARITASVAGVSDSASFTVTPAPVQSVKVLPHDRYGVVGDNVRLAPRRRTRSASPTAVRRGGARRTARSRRWTRPGS